MAKKIIVCLLAVIIVFSGCATTKTSSKFREDGTPVGIYPPPTLGFIKKRIAIIPFKDKTNQKHTNTDLGSQAVDIATTLIVNADRFEVVERERLDAVLKEQKLVGIVDAKTAAEVGKVLGVDLIFTGAITDFEVKRTKTGGRIGIPRIGNLPSFDIKKETHILSILMAIDARIFRTDTAEILFAGTGEIKREEKASGFRLGIDEFEIDTEGAIKLDQSAAGRQLRMAIDQIIRQLVPKVDNAYAPINTAPIEETKE